MILNVSAPLAGMPYIPSLGAYASSKAALTLITLTARAELAADNIRVGVIYPGMTHCLMEESYFERRGCLMGNLTLSSVCQAVDSWDVGH